MARGTGLPYGRKVQQQGFSEGAVASPAGAAQVVVPFCQGSKPEIEEAFLFTNVEVKAGAQTLGPIALPANGYIRHVVIEVTTTAATGATGESAADGPWTLLEQVKLTEPNGAPLGAELTGYNLFLANILGRYVGTPDPRLQPGFLNEAATGKMQFTLRVPVELAPNGLGALGNQSASAALRLQLKIGPESTVYKKTPSVAAKYQIRILNELWGEPPERDVLGRAVAQSPPYEGTAQYWSEQPAVTINKGNNSTRITRVGSEIRTLIFVFREAGARSNKACPEPIQLQWDQRVFRVLTQNQDEIWQIEMIPSLWSKKVETGVFWFPFSQGEHREAGENEINSWLGTLTSTRLELLGNSEKAGTVDILVNDVSVTAVNPAERTLQVGVGGYHPPIGETSAVAA